MHKRMLILLVGLFLILCPSYAMSQPQDVEGWDKAKWGMKAGEIENNFSGQVHPPIERSKGIDWYVSWEILAINLGECAATVRFIMDSEKEELNKVILIVHDGNRDHYDFLLEQLINKYGRPTHPNKPMGVGKENQYNKWVFPSTIIMLSIVKAAKQDVRITYEVNEGSSKP